MNVNNTPSTQSKQPTKPDAFAALGLSETLCRTVAQAGYSTPTPIQTEAIGHVLAGKDLMGSAQTGTGKTAAFALPILQNLMASDRGRGRDIRCLVVAPTRELAAQIGANFETYAGRGGPRQRVIFGGVGKGGQIQALKRGVEVLVATPGRLLDLMGDGIVDLSYVETFVLDEADRMLDMGFIHDVRRIIKALPRERQTLMFSATMPKEIRHLADSILRRPVRVAVDPVSSAREPIAQSVYHVEKAQKTSLLIQLVQDQNIERALVFTRTKHGANRVAQKLVRAGLGAAAIHGNKSQSARVKTLADFKAGRIRVVVATDIAARGIDIKELSHVINFDLPNEPESYVHRIGRTGRAGLSGIALSFCAADESAYLRSIERLIKRRLDEEPLPKGLAKPARAQPATQRPQSEQNRYSPRGRPQQRRRSAQGARRTATR